jgi:hypothetical protein
MKKVKKIIVILSIFLAIVLLPVGLYFLFNAVQTHTPQKLNEQQVKLYLKALDPVESDPYYFVAEKFDTHDIIFIGEMHKRKQDLDFFSKLIPYLYQKKKIKIIGWEFGAAVFQKDADSVVNAPAFDRRKAIAILRRNDFGWCYEEYLEIFHTIWQVNKGVKNAADKIKFLQLNGPYNPKKRNSSDTGIRNAEAKMYFDNMFPGIVEKEVLQKNQKILIYCGLHHSLTKFYTPKFLFNKDSGRGGQYLYKKYPGKVFQIVMLSPFLPRWFLFKGNQISGVYPFDGVFNQLYDTLKRPFAVNSNKRPFSEVQDFNSFYEFDSWNGVKFKDFCDGAIMIASFKEIVPIHIIKDWVITQQDLDEVKSVLQPADAKNIHTQQDLYNYISPEENRTAIKSFHQLPKFW